MTATITWTTNEPCDSKADFGLTSGLLTSNVYNAGMVTSHSITLSGLTPTTTYYYRVTSVDHAGHSVTMPSAPDTYSFTTPGIMCAQDMTLADFSQGTPDAGTLGVNLAQLLFLPSEIRRTKDIWEH